MTGWIFDHRKEIESNIWLMPPMYHRVWQWLKYKVNHSPAKIPNRDGTFTTIKPGQHATSYRIIARGVGYYEGLKWKEPNAKTIKSILDWMVTQEMITVQGNTLGTIITVVNWEVYQKEAVQGNTKETRKKHSLDTNKNDKEELKNEKETTAVPFAEIQKLYEEICKSYPKIRNLSEKRKASIRARYKEYNCDITVFEELFTKAEASPFLKGENDRNWKADFDWMIAESNMAKILEGKYNDKKQASGGIVKFDNDVAKTAQLKRERKEELERKKREAGVDGW